MKVLIYKNDSFSQVTCVVYCLCVRQFSGLCFFVSVNMAGSGVAVPVNGQRECCA